MYKLVVLLGSASAIAGLVIMVGIANQMARQLPEVVKETEGGLMDVERTQFPQDEV